MNLWTMDELPPQTPAPYQYTHPAKKGLGTGAKVGIGCGIIAILLIIGLVIGGMMLGSKFGKFAEDVQKSPTRTAATMVVTFSGGKMKMIAEDDAKQRYTIKDESSGVLMTFYWDEQTKTPKTVTGDFSAIPGAEAAPTADPAVEDTK
jgi:hypothetical protein